MPGNTSFAKGKHMYIFHSEPNIWPFGWICSNEPPIGISLWHCYKSTSLRWDHVWLASSRATQSCIKYCPFGIAFALHVGLDHIL